MEDKKVEHQYLKVNWQNIIVVKNKIEDIRQFALTVNNKLLEMDKQQ